MKVLAIIGVVVARSTEWELGVRWHIMIPPYDSLTSDQPAPYVTDPDDVPWR